MEITVHYNKLNIAPRKIRAILHRVRGRRVVDALSEITVSPRATASPIKKLLLASVSAAKDRRPDAKIEDLIVKTIFCNEAMRLPRTVLRGRGRASRINKQGSHLTLTILDNKKTIQTKPKTDSKKKV